MKLRAHSFQNVYKEITQPNNHIQLNTMSSTLLAAALVSHLSHKSLPSTVPGSLNLHLTSSTLFLDGACTGCQPSSVQATQVIH